MASGYALRHLAHQGNANLQNFQDLTLLLFHYDGEGPVSGTAFLRNVQRQKSKYKIPGHRIILETKFLYPLVRGSEIKAFRHDYQGIIVPFPYVGRDPHRPLGVAQLGNHSPHLLEHYQRFEETIRQQTKFSDKIRGANAGEFYGLARTGPYSFAETYVAFRDNTDWCASVVTPIKTPWSSVKRFVFQNHAVSMCERPSGGFITDDEAHYICAILNAPIVQRFIYGSSDERSFNIRPPVYIPEFDRTDERHRKLSSLSQEAHRERSRVEELQRSIDHLYLDLCLRRK